MRRHGLQFPVVLKPDAGQRGSGVAIVRSLEQLREYLTNSKFPAILQEYVPGEEYGMQIEFPELGNGIGGGVLDRVTDDEHGASNAVPADQDRGAARGFGIVLRGAELVGKVK